MSAATVTARAAGVGLLGAALVGGSLAGAFEGDTRARPTPLSDAHYPQRFHAQEHGWRAAKPGATGWRVSPAEDTGRIRRGEADHWGARPVAGGATPD